MIVKPGYDSIIGDDGHGRYMVNSKGFCDNRVMKKVGFIFVMLLIPRSYQVVSSLRHIHGGVFGTVPIGDFVATSFIDRIDGSVLIIHMRHFNHVGWQELIYHMCEF